MVRICCLILSTAFLSACSLSELDWSKWDTLETAKFIVSLATPVLAAFIAFQLARYGTKLDKLKSVNQELIKKRLEVFKNVSPPLNDIYCYCRFIGKWRSFEPADIIAKKRYLDHEIHVHKALFSVAFFDAYTAFIRSVFQEYNGFGKPALIRKSLRELQVNWTQQHWKSDWNGSFTNEGVSEHQLNTTYNAFMIQLAREIGVEGIKPDNT